jgi:predicted transcriptional regulator
MFSHSRTISFSVMDPFLNRSRLGIIYQILLICHNDLMSQTRLMYKANLSYFQLKKYVPTLTAKNLLQETLHDGKKTYMTTARGRHFVEAFRDLTQLLGTTSPKRFPAIGTF